MSGLRQPPPNLSRVSSNQSVNTTATGGTSDGHNAALLGATRAFARPQPTPKNNDSVPSGANATMKSAPRIGTMGNWSGSRRSPEGATVERGNNTSRAATGRQELPVLPRTQTPALAVPTHDTPGRAKSPSHQAARLATARPPEPTPQPAAPRAPAMQKPSIAPKPRRLSERFSQPSSPTDDSPIPPTNSLVQLFERKTSTPASPQYAQRPHPVAIRPSKELPIKSPKPMRRSQGSGITSVFQMELDNGNAKMDKSTNTASTKGQARYDGQSSSSEDYVSASEDTAATSSPITVRKLRDSRAPSMDSEAAPSALGSPERRQPRPPPSPMRHTHAPSQPIRIQQASPRPMTSPSSVSLSSAQSGNASIAAQYHMLHPRRVTPLHTGEDLANAIVASSIASSRAVSPHKSRLEPLPPPTRWTRHGFSRTPSPVKHGMRHTLRKEESETDEGEDDFHPYGKHRKKRLVRKHPNKHHEGDRKRWRDAVTERERKRYEGVWAANKGLYTTFTLEEEAVFRRQPESEETKAKHAAAAEQVSNIVARDIWSRSRLADSVMETIWDLVDHDCVGRLSKEEFVVGMWLIDQRLKGRKLPTKVTESVWTSVRGVGGIKVRGSKMH